MNPLSLIRQFIKGLTKENEPYQIALGISFGFLIGLIPKNNLTAQLLFIILMSTKANLPFAFIVMILLSFISFLTDLIVGPLGYFVLNLSFLNSFFTKLYNMPIIPWTDFNNTIVMGGLLTGIVLFVPIYILGKKFGLYYNQKFKEKIINSKWVKYFKKTWLLDWYFK